MSTPHIDANLYCRKEERTELGDLSKLAFGARGKWKKIATQYGLEIHEIKEQMQRMIYNNAMKRRQLEDASKEIRSGEAESKSSADDVTDGRSESDDVRSEEIRRSQLETGNEMDSTSKRSDETSNSLD